MAQAFFRFYEELNDFLPAGQRKCGFLAPLAAQASVKQAIEALGVPHTEVELILVDGRSVDFSYRLRGGERISVYPKFECLDITPLLRVRPAPLRAMRFVADAHLGGLARLLRLAGFDTLFRNDYPDDEVVRLSVEEQRIALSKDRELLKRREITHGCYVHARSPPEQFREIVQRLDLERAFRPFSRCLICNGPLHPTSCDEVADRVPAGVTDRYREFARCGGCDRVYWPGSHWRRMRSALEAATRPSGAGPAAP